MNGHDENKPLTDTQARRLADSVIANLDDSVSDDVAARLRAARQEAVFIAERKTRSTRRWVGTLAPLGATAAAVAVVIVALNVRVDQAAPILDDIEMAAAAEMEFLDELEMLAWLDEAELDAG